MRIVFLGSPPFAEPVLARLIEGEHEIAAVVTPPGRSRGRGRERRPSPVAELARRHGLRVLQPESARDPDLLAELRVLEPALMMVASYGELLPNELLEIAPEGCLNVHGSLLPRHRGASPVQAAILAGDATTGVSIQKVVEALDAGDVLLALETPIAPDETAGELFDRLALLGAEAAQQAIDRVEAGEAVYTPQDPALVTVCRKIRKEHGSIDWSRPAAELARHVRAMNPWPAATTALPDGRALQVLRARVAGDAEGSGGSGSAPGTLLDTDGRLVVATGDGALELTEVKPAGRRAMPAADFLRGTPLEAGQRLDT